MNKSELVDALAERTTGDKKAAAAVVDNFVDIVLRQVASGEKVSITGFGVFEKRTRAARTARNPATGASIRLKKTSVPAFRAGTGFKNVVNGTTKLPKLTASKAGAKGTTTRATTAKSATRATKATTATTAKAAPKATTKATATTKAKATPATKAASGRTSAAKSTAKAPAASSTKSTAKPAAKRSTKK